VILLEKNCSPCNFPEKNSKKSGKFYNFQEKNSKTGKGVLVI
jgi:hypothetical protein